MGLFDDLKDGIQNSLPKIIPDVIKKPLKEAYWIGHNSLRGRTKDPETNNNAEIAKEIKTLREVIEAQSKIPEIQTDIPLAESTEESIDDHPEDVVKPIISSIELSPRLKRGKKDYNQVIISYSNSEVISYTVTSELFYFLYLLCLDRLSDEQERWIPLKSDINMKYINIMEDFIRGRLPRYFSWIENKSQKQTVVSKINNGIAPIINRIDEETANNGQESYYSLVSSLSTEDKIALNRLE